MYPDVASALLVPARTLPYVSWVSGFGDFFTTFASWIQATLAVSCVLCDIKKTTNANH